MSELQLEAKVPLQNDGVPISYRSMDKKSTGEILNVISDENSDKQRSANSALKGELKINQVRGLVSFIKVCIKV